MKELLTEAQRAVVEHRSGALLVSASAGSGKTRVLVERVLEKVSQGCNIDEFLIVTFTIAAAAELRVKLTDELGARLALDPQNEHLRRQFTRIGFAQISTVHSFCAEILRSYAHLCDLPASFVVADEQQSAPLRQRAAESAIEYAYRESEADEDLAALLGTLGYARDDRKLTELLLDAYDDIQAHARPMAWLDACTAELEKVTEGVEQTVWGKALLSDFRAMLALKMQQFDYAISLIDQTPELAPYRPNFEAERDMFARLALLSWDELGETQPTFFSLDRVGKGADPYIKKTVTTIRDNTKKTLKSWMIHFAGGSAAATADLLRTAAPLRGLFTLLRYFDGEYTAEKRRRRLLDFGDLEHEAVKLLDENDSPTAAASEIAARFTEIMVDEYQDSNAVQDAIYRAVSKNGENLFFVGDVKQSIYGFRLADPTIFSEKYRTYAERGNDGTSPRKILLTQNFRSSPAILGAVNFVFGALMTERVGGVDYTEKEQMQSGRPNDFPDLGEPTVELHCIDSGDVDEDDAADRIEIEARFVAQRVRELLDGEQISDGRGGTRPIRPGDIAVLSRSYASVAPAVLEELHRAGIPAVGRGNVDPFTSLPVQSFIAMLRAVRNPRMSAALAAAMLSPVGAFTADELARVRLAAQGDLCDALTASAETDEKSAAFLRRLSALREKARWMPLDALLDETVAVFEMEQVFGAMPDGEELLVGFSLFRAACAEMIERGTDDLGQLLLQLDDMREKKQRFTTNDDVALDCVRVLSVHASKGLEYPVVLLCDLARQFNTMDLKDPLLTDSKLMAACNIVDVELMAKYPGAAKTALKNKLERDLVSEEMRLLYVAMTRPKERLILTFCSKDVQKKLDGVGMFASREALRLFADEKANCLGDWVLMAAASRPEASVLFPETAKHPTSDAPWRVEMHGAPEKTAPRAYDVGAATPIDETCLDRGYVFSDAPAKITATQLKGRALDRESADGAGKLSMPQPEIRERPFSLAGRPLSATERGTAMHLFLQFCRYEACCDEAGVAAEKARLVREAFFTQEQADCVAEQAVTAFFTSEIGSRILTAPFLRREFKFSLLQEADTLFAPKAPLCKGSWREAPEGLYASDTMQAASHTPDVLLQGVVDCFWREEGGLCVLDFKTDSVSADGAAARAETYRPQIEAYADALQRIYGEPVKEKILYFFRCGKAISL